MPTCPNGHQSAAYDWCEVCGHQMPEAHGAQGGHVPPPPPPPPLAGYGFPPPPQQASGQYPTGPAQGGHTAERCPQCGTAREAQAHFCEECRYNFLTGQPTAYPTPGPPPGGYPPAGAAPLDTSGSGRSEMQRPAEPIPPQAPGGPGAETSWNLAPPNSGGQAPQYQQGPPPHPGSHHPSPPEQSYPQGRQQPGPYPGQQFQGGSGHYPGGQQYPGGSEQSYPQGGAPAPQHPYPQPDQPQYGYPPQQGGAPQQAQQFSPQAPPQQFSQQGPPQQFAPPGQQQGQPPYQQQPHPQQPGRTGWQVSITQDPEYFEAMMERSGPEGAGLQIPQSGPGRQLPLSGQQVTIGRRRQSTGEAPDIDLGQAPEDPGVSHQHAKLVQQPDGSWAVVDEDSTNGTTLNGAEDPIQPFVPITLQEGDRIHVGAWTTITLHRA